MKGTSSDETCQINWSHPNSWFRSKLLKWLRLQLETCLPWPSSAWSSARRWQAREWCSPSPSQLAMVSLSPWTPKSLKNLLLLWLNKSRRRRRRSWVHLMSGGIKEGAKNSWKGSLKEGQMKALLCCKLLRRSVLHIRWLIFSLHLSINRGMKRTQCHPLCHHLLLPCL